MRLLNGPTTAPRGRLAIIVVLGVSVVLLGLWGTEEGAEAGFADSDGRERTSAPTVAAAAGPVGASYAFARRAASKVTGNLFAVQSWYIAPPPPPPRPATVVVPTAPPLPFAFLGSYARASEKPVFFLTRGDVVYDVRAGDTIDSTYLVEGIENGSLIFTYQPLKQRQSLLVGN